MTIDRWTEIRGSRSRHHRACVPTMNRNRPCSHLEIDDLQHVEPLWAKYVAGVVAEMRPTRGIDGTVTTTIPIGAGLSSSAALEVAVALALGYAGDAAGWPSCAAAPRSAGVGRALRDHGPTDHRRRRGRPCSADRLRRSHDRAGEDPRRCRDRRAVHRSSHAGRQRLRRPRRRMRDGGGDHRSAAHRHAATICCRSPMRSCAPEPCTWSTRTNGFAISRRRSRPGI